MNLMSGQGGLIMYSLTKYMIKDGDTLQYIAQKELGDASKATDIAIFNDLDYPFIGRIGDTPVSGVKLPGDIISIPIEVDTSDVLGSSVYEENYSDLLLTTNSNLTDYSGGELSTDLYGDLQVVSGEGSITQDIVHRFKTEKGTLLYHPTYGSDLLSLIGINKDDTWLQKVTIEVLRTMRSDPRIKEINNLNITSITEGVQIECTLSTNYSQQIKFNQSIVQEV